MDTREELVPLSEASNLEILPRGTVSIRHPVVGKSLFSFPAYSYPKPLDALEIPFGVLHSLALDACRIITDGAAGNREDFLAEDHDGKTRVSIDAVKLLAPGDYYYFLGPGTHTTNYPIVKEFSAFRFPDRIPDHWYDTRPSARLRRGVDVFSSSAMSVSVVKRDQYCSITKQAYFIKCVHLVPKAEEAWFVANEMHIYAMENQKAGVDTHTNGISLRDDVHRCMDTGAFVFYPAHDTDKFMAYFVSDGYWPDYPEMFHRTLVAIHPSVAVEFLYARFAYAVIKLFRPSLFFTSVKDNPDVKLAVARLESLKKADQTQTASTTKEPVLPRVDESGNTKVNDASEHSRVSEGAEESGIGSSASNHSLQSPPQESFADGDERWQKRLFRRIPGMAALEEVEDPPDVVDCHSETPHIMRLTSEYIKENPQVWQTSTTPEGAARDDDEGWYAAWMTRPL